jgi:putative DNA primase/helicase
MSYADALADFIAFMEANGVVPDEPIVQRLSGGDLIRFRCEGDGKGRKNGWAILYLDERPAGAFGNYRMNTGTLKWKASSDAPALSPAERERLQAEWREARDRREAERAQNQTEAARDAAEIWARAGSAADHPYVTAKGIDHRPLRRDGDSLLVPMCDTEGTVRNLQRIKPGGEKRFLHGGRVDDLFAVIGVCTARGGQAILVEGYATGDTLHRATGHPVIVTFNTSNLRRVARIWNELRPDLHYTVFADDDEQTALREAERTGVYKNPGIEAAEAAAAEIGAAVAYPMGKPMGRAA